MQDTTTHLVHLEDRRLLRISGGDAQDFLNGLVTADIAKLADGAQCHGGLLSPQGKILFEFVVHRSGDAYWIDVAEAAHADLAKRLGFYKLRADVEISVVDEAQVMAAWGAAPGDAIDPRLAELGSRFVVPNGADAVFAAHYIPATLSDYEAHRIRLCVPESIKDYPLGAVFPHDACFDQLGGVSFTKGCYVGQEVVSRMRHRGTARKRTLRITGDSDLAASGTDVLAGERAIGVMGSSDGAQGIAMVRLDRAAKALANGVAITCDGRPVTLAVPGWAGFSLELVEDAS